MSGSLPPDDDPELVARLRSLGAVPVDAAVRTRHLAAIAAVTSRRRRARRLVAGTAILVGSLAGSTGLAAAGALGPAARNAVLRTVGVETAPGHDRYDGPECAGPPARNRGQYLAQEAAKGEAALEAAKATDCAKPARAVDPATRTAPPRPVDAADRDRPSNVGPSGRRRPAPATPADPDGKRGRSGEAPGRGQSEKTTPRAGAAGDADMTKGRGDSGKAATVGEPGAAGQPECAPGGDDSAGTQGGDDGAGRAEQGQRGERGAGEDCRVARGDGPGGSAGR